MQTSGRVIFQAKEQPMQNPKMTRAGVLEVEEVDWDDWHRMSEGESGRI